jgi:hypothetical protein
VISRLPKEAPRQAAASLKKFLQTSRWFAGVLTPANPRFSRYACISDFGIGFVRRSSRKLRVSPSNIAAANGLKRGGARSDINVAQGQDD